MATGFRQVTGTVTGQAGSLITFLDGLLNIGVGGTYWEKVFSGTNKAVYRATTGERYYLRVDDSTGNLAAVRGYETMTDVDTGTGQFPTTTQQTNYNTRKSSTADATTRAVVGVATSRYFLLLITGGWGGSGQDIMIFGEPKRVASADAGTTVLRAHNAATYSGAGFSNGAIGTFSSITPLGAAASNPANNANTMFPMAKTYDGLSNAALGFVGTAYTNASTPGYSTLGYLPLVPVFLESAVVAGSSARLRAILPYVYGLILRSNDTGIAKGDTFEDADGASYVVCTPDGDTAVGTNVPYFAVMVSDGDPEVL